MNPKLVTSLSFVYGNGIKIWNKDSQQMLNTFVAQYLYTDI